MTGLETLTLILQGLLPLALIAWVARPHRTRLSLALDVAVAAAYLVAVALAGIWLALPRALVLTHAVLLTGAAIYGTRGGPRGGTDDGTRGGSPASGSVLARLGVWTRGVIALGLSALVVTALAGRLMPEGDAVDLTFPLSDGTYLVAAGGSNELINPHRMTASGERYRAWVGQSHAVDLVKLGSWGSREGVFSPDEPHGFAIFGDPLTAPCAGTVVVAEDGHPDVLAPGTEPPTLEGNHVIVACGDVWVVLAHLQRGSVCVSPGDDVRIGDPLGRVGNSGQSDEPHLHIHAQTPGTEAAPLGGDPVPITFEGRYLVRNDRAHAASEYPGGHTTND